MKYIQVPEDIQVMLNGVAWKDSNDKVMPPWSIGTYLQNVLLPDPAVGPAGYKTWKSCAIIDAQFSDITPGEWIGVEEEHWNMLKTAIVEPKGGGIHQCVLRQLIPFMDAILEAKNEKPDEEE